MKQMKGQLDPFALWYGDIPGAMVKFRILGGEIFGVEEARISGQFVGAVRCCEERENNILIYWDYQISMLPLNFALTPRFKERRIRRCINDGVVGVRIGKLFERIHRFSWA